MAVSVADLFCVFAEWRFVFLGWCFVVGIFAVVFVCGMVVLLSTLRTVQVSRLSDVGSGNHVILRLFIETDQPTAIDARLIISVIVFAELTHSLPPFLNETTGVDSEREVCCREKSL